MFSVVSNYCILFFFQWISFKPFFGHHEYDVLTKEKQPWVLPWTVDMLGLLKNYHIYVITGFVSSLKDRRGTARKENLSSDISYSQVRFPTISRLLAGLCYLGLSCWIIGSASIKGNFSFDYRMQNECPIWQQVTTFSCFYLLLLVHLFQPTAISLSTTTDPHAQKHYLLFRQELKLLLKMKPELRHLYSDCISTIALLTHATSSLYIHAAICLCSL